MKLESRNERLQNQVGDLENLVKELKLQLKEKTKLNDIVYT